MLLTTKNVINIINTSPKIITYVRYLKVKRANKALMNEMNIRLQSPLVEEVKVNEKFNVQKV